MAKAKVEEKKEFEYKRPEGTYFVLHNGSIQFLGPSGIIPIVDPVYVETLKLVTLNSHSRVDRSIFVELIHWEIQECPVGDLTTRLADWLTNNFDIKLKDKRA